MHGQTIGWDAVPLEELLRTDSPLPGSVRYFIDNGAKTLGQAEMWFGGGRGARSAVVVLFGSGLGACLVTPEVEHGRAVEWGHLTVRVRGRRCRCGALGCLEAYAGAESLLERWGKRAATRPRAPTRRTRWPRCSPPPIRPRVPRATRWPWPSWRRPPSTWARACPT